MAWLDQLAQIEELEDAEFDAELVALRDVTLEPAGPDWEVRFEEFRPGYWDVGARDPMLPAQPTNPPLGDLEGGPLLHFEFGILGPGTSEVYFQMLEIVDFSPSTETPCCIVRDVATIRGAITQDPVANESVSFGAVKARFRR